tara:strand:+ start:169 stop:429 length:261 start_codon:yes stop_codon:yes gene_type:complete
MRLFLFRCDKNDKNDGSFCFFLDDDDDDDDDKIFTGKAITFFYFIVPWIDRKKPVCKREQKRILVEKKEYGVDCSVTVVVSVVDVV